MTTKKQPVEQALTINLTMNGEKREMTQQQKEAPEKRLDWEDQERLALNLWVWLLTYWAWCHLKVRA